ncbi:MAG: PKD domain-containing protein [Planctomycetes bacterium]|nr:PKD domain-containing protein [Planctomycetota bacterium]
MTYTTRDACGLRIEDFGLRIERRPAGVTCGAWPFNPQCAIRNPQFAIRNGRRRGFSLVEAVISIFIVSVMMVVALTVLGASRAGQARMADRARGHQLALDLMNEILQAAYFEPDDAALFGPEGIEVGTGRMYFDDVDDYAGWTESPPQTRSGVATSALADWTRSVAVEWASPNDLSCASATATDIKRITVTVLHGVVPAARLVAVRTVAWALEQPQGADLSGNRPPTAIARTDAAEVKAGAAVGLDGRNSIDPDADSLSFAWNFGDGGGAAGSTAAHAYAAPGTYTVTLKVSDGRGGVDTDRLAITVTP